MDMLNFENRGIGSLTSCKPPRLCLVREPNSVTTSMTATTQLWRHSFSSKHHATATTSADICFQPIGRCIIFGSHCFLACLEADSLSHCNAHDHDYDNNDEDTAAAALRERATRRAHGDGAGPSRARHDGCLASTFLLALLGITTVFSPDVLNRWRMGRGAF